MRLKALASAVLDRNTTTENRVQQTPATDQTRNTHATAAAGHVQALHPGHGNPASLKRRIRSMADRWGYDDDDLSLALAGAEQDPAGWLSVVEADEALGVTAEGINGGGNEG